jgi:hypothetical protein
MKWCRLAPVVRTIVHALVLSVLISLRAGAAGDVDVRGNSILRDGRPWVARGVVITGLVAPQGVINGYYAEARAHFGDQELDAIKRYGADLIRFQIGQAGTDPRSSIYSAQYVAEVKRAVALARGHGFSVIVSLQAQAPSGIDQKGMPSDSSSRSWKILAPLFASDQGVMFELFNEPAPFGLPHNWDTWRQTMQHLIDEIRNAARNVLIADGLHWAKNVDGAPLLHDPVSRIVYAVHPYPRKDDVDRADWDRTFGHFSATAPVLVTEWNARSGRNCFAGPRHYTPAIAADFLSFISEHRIGIVGWAFDLPGTLINDYDWSLTNYDGFQCRGRTPLGPNTSAGAGELLHRYFTR